MRLHGSLIVTATLFAQCANSQTGSPTGWDQVLSSVNLERDSRLYVAGAKEPAAPDWTARIASGAVLILDGESRLAASLGFRPSKQLLTVTSMRDVHEPKTRIILE